MSSAKTWVSFGNLRLVLLAEDGAGLPNAELALTAERLAADLFEHRVPVDLTQRFGFALACVCKVTHTLDEGSTGHPLVVCRSGDNVFELSCLS